MLEPFASVPPILTACMHVIYDKDISQSVWFLSYAAMLIWHISIFIDVQKLDGSDE
jgi:hypothetical protein